MSRTFEQGVAAIKAMHEHKVIIGANHCKQRTREAMGVGSNGTVTAYQSWLSIPGSLKNQTSTPSQIRHSSFVYFSGGSTGSGHVGVIDEAGVFWTPGGPSDSIHWTPTTISALLKRWSNLRLVGWSYMIDSVVPARPSVPVTPTHPVPPPIVFKKPQRQPKGWSSYYHAPDSKTWMGDSLRGVHRGAARAPVGHPGRAVDINTVGCTSDGVWVGCHNPRPLLHGYHNTGKANVGLRVLISGLTFAVVHQFEAEPKSRVPYPIRDLPILLAEADRLNVRVELEIKAYATLAQWRRLVADKHVQSLLQKNLLVVKTLAAMPGAVARLTPAHAVGIPTLLSFTKYKGKGISAKQAWPVVTYTRGTPRWVA